MKKSYSLLLLSVIWLAGTSLSMAGVTYATGSGDPIQSDNTAATDAIENGYGLTPDDFGLPAATGPDGQPLTEEELQAIEKMRSGEGDPGFQQKENDPANQVYKGATKKRNQYEPPRTHRMYDDTRY